MPTIFERLDGVLDGSLDVQISGEAENLTGVVTTVVGLISDPPDDLGDFVQGLAETPLPDLEVSGSLTTNLQGIRDALPSDLGDVTGSPDTILTALENAAGLDLTQILERVLETVRAMERLLGTDLTCGLRAAGAPTGAAPAGNGADGGNGAGGGNGTGDGGDGTGDGGDGTGDGDASEPSTGAQAVRDGIGRTTGILDELPSPLDVASLLEWLGGMAIPRPGGFALRSLPVVESLRDPLESLLAWKGMTAADVLAHFVASLEATETFVEQSRKAVLDTPLADLTELSEQFQGIRLAEIADALTLQLGKLRTLIDAGDLSATEPAAAAMDAVAAMNTALGQYETLPDVLGPLPALLRRIEELPLDLEDQMSHVVSVLQGDAALGRLALGPSAPGDADAAFAELESFLDTYLAFFENLVDAVDFSALQDPLSTAAGALRDAVDGLDQALVGVTLAIQEQFSAVEGLLDEVDTTAMIAEAEAAIDQFKVLLIQQLSDAFAPVREVIRSVVTQIDEAVDDFKPDTVVQPIKDALGDIAGVFEDRDVVDALDTVRNGLAEVTQLVQDLSFTPVIDEVVAAIEEMAAALETIDADELSALLKAALSAALAVLPEDITPVTDPIVDEFGELVDAGPVPLVEAVKDQPQRLLDKVRAFDPGSLIGSVLAEPYQELMTGVESFQPSRLLDAASAELDGLKDRLRQNANPALAVAPLVPLFEGLLEGLDALDPGNLTQPLEDRIQEVINGILDTLPVDEAFEQVDVVVATVVDALAIGGEFVALAERIRDLFAGFADSRQQLQTWLDGILDKVDAVSTAPLATPLAALTSTLESLREAPLQGAFDLAADALLAKLAFDPETRLADLAQAYHRVSRPALAALPETAEKTAVLGVLNRFDPTEAAFSAPFRALAELRAALSGAKDNLAAALASWDERYHDADGIVACYRQTEPTAAQLRQWLEEALEHQFVKPAAAFFVLLDLGGGMVAAFLTPLQSTLSALQDKLDALLLGPDSLTGIRDAMQELIQRLRDFNLGFITDTVDELFATVRGKLEALGPAQLQAALDAAFEEMLATLDLSLAIPSESLAGIDAAYGDVVDKLRGLDPQKLVTEMVQPLYDSTVSPLVDAIDFTPLLTALVEKLGGLDDELRAEMQRVNTAYQELLRSAPDVSLSIDVGVSF